MATTQWVVSKNFNRMPDSLRPPGGSDRIPKTLPWPESGRLASPEDLVSAAVVVGYTRQCSLVQ